MPKPIRSNERIMLEGRLSRKKSIKKKPSKKLSKKLLTRKSSERKHSKKKHYEVKKDKKNHKCHVNYESCNKVPEPLDVENMDCLKNFWEEGKYKHILNFFPSITLKYPNGYIEKSYGNITHKDNYRINMSLIGDRYIKNEKRIPINFDLNYIRNHKGQIIRNYINSLGANSNGYLTKCTPTEIEEFYESNSEAFGKNIWYKGIIKKTDNGYKCMWMQTTDLNKPWALTYEDEWTRLRNRKKHSKKKHSKKKHSKKKKVL